MMAEEVLSRQLPCSMLYLSEETELSHEPQHTSLETPCLFSSLLPLLHLNPEDSTDSLALITTQKQH